MVDVRRPYLFLDIDGVLNSEQYYWRRQPDEWPHLDCGAIARLDRIVRETNALVVVSSSWRGEPRLLGWLRERGYTGDLYDMTPRRPMGCRGDEIAAWLTDNRRNGEPFAILDDADDMGIVAAHLVRTDWRYGLLDEHVEQAIALLTAESALREVSRDA